MNTVVDLDYFAISVDSSIIVANGYGFDRPPLNLMFQFKGRPVGLVISEVVQGEICSQLASKIRDARGAISASLRDASRSNISNDLGFDFQEVPGFDPSAAADAKWGKFIEDTGAEIISASEVDSSDVVRMYFNGESPFAFGKKKSEFPDAFALLSLEEFAKKNGGKILLVSRDGDWKGFSDQSDYLDCTDDLSSALSKFVPQTSAFDFCLSLANGNVSPAHQDFLDLINDVASSKFADGDYSEEVDASSRLTWEYDHGIAELLDLRAADGLGGFEVNLTSINNDGWSFSLKAVAEIRFCAEFELSAYDYVDRDYVGVGRATAEEDIDVDVEFFVNVSIDGGVNDSPVPVIENVEMIISPFFVDFGEIEPNHDEWD